MIGPGFVGASLQVADLGWRQMIRSKLLIGVGLAIVFAAGMTVVVSGESSRFGAAQNVQAMQLLILSNIVVPFIALLLGTGALASEREGGTLAYLFSRPFPRAAVVLGKGLGAMAVSCAAVILCVLLVWAVAGAPRDSQLLGGLGALTLQAVALTALFVLFGTLHARSLYIGLAYVVFFEGVLGNVQATDSWYTVGHHARNLLTEWSAEALRGESVFDPIPGGPFESILVMLVVTVAALAAACAWVEKREYGLKDRPKEE